MSVVVIGSSGLLGATLAAQHDVISLSRTQCDITDPVSIVTMFGWYKPDIVINCAGIVPKAEEQAGVMQTLRVNALGPKILREVCEEYGARLVHISTNCIFKGYSGGYLEDSIPNPADMYGMSKHLGEVTDAPHLTVRTSFVGLPDAGMRGLLLWAKKQKVLIGYDKLFWNGLTANELGVILFNVLIPQKVTGIVHLHGETVSKYDLLVRAKEILGWETEIVKESDIEGLKEPHIGDQTLGSFYPEYQTAKTVREMLREMKEQNGL